MVPLSMPASGRAIGKRSGIRATIVVVLGPVKGSRRLVPLLEDQHQVATIMIAKGASVP
jgi:uncharacterized protein involved in outer membrane biogenesis